MRRNCVSMRASTVPSLERTTHPPRAIPARATIETVAPSGSAALSCGIDSATIGASSGETSMVTRVARAKSATAACASRAITDRSPAMCSRTMLSAIETAMPASSRSAKRIVSSRTPIHRENSTANDVSIVRNAALCSSFAAACPSIAPLVRPSARPTAVPCASPLA